MKNVKTVKSEVQILIDELIELDADFDLRLYGDALQATSSLVGFQLKIDNFLADLEIDDLELIIYINVEDIDIDNAFDSMTLMLEDNNAFDIDIIYYTTAMEYLIEHDSSLSESMAIASELGFETANINSELLASLLASQRVRESWQELEQEITDFFDEINYERNLLIDYNESI